MVMQVVSGRWRADAKLAKGARVSPRPCRRMRMFVLRAGVSGGVMVREREAGKSARLGTGAILGIWKVG